MTISTLVVRCPTSSITGEMSTAISRLGRRSSSASLLMTCTPLRKSLTENARRRKFAGAKHSETRAVAGQSARTRP